MARAEKTAAPKREIVKPKSFQDIILKLSAYWSSKGCAILQPYDMEVGAGTSHTATFLRAIGLDMATRDALDRFVAELDGEIGAGDSGKPRHL